MQVWEVLEVSIGGCTVICSEIRVSSFVSWIPIAQTAVQETAPAMVVIEVEQLFMREMHQLASASASARTILLMRGSI
jgi:hypothetical protein